MKMPSKGTPVTVDGYGTGLFVGLDGKNDEVWLKFEGGDLDEGYGRGIVTIDLDYYHENKVHWEQLPDGADPDISVEKRVEQLGE